MTEREALRAAQDARWHGDLLAVDPSVISPGAALFRHGVLVACGRVRVPVAAKQLDRGARCLRVAQEVVAWWRQACADAADLGGIASRAPTAAIRTVVFEWPQVYQREEGRGGRSKTKGDPNQLIGLAGVGQALAATIAAENTARDVRPPEVVTPLPAEWTGQIPKATRGDPWRSPRGARIRERLEVGELAVVPAQHDAIDALGLGLWALGRYERRRAFPGCT